MTSKVCKLSVQAKDIAENSTSNDDRIGVAVEILRKDNNNIIKIYRSCQKFNIKFQISKVMSKEHPNPLNNFCKPCHVESAKSFFWYTPLINIQKI